MEKLKIKELEVGEIYFTIVPSGNRYIIRLAHISADYYEQCILHRISTINLDYEEFYGKDKGTVGSKSYPIHSPYSNLKTIRKATEKEKQHLIACEKAKKYVSANYSNDESNFYPIY